MKITLAEAVPLRGIIYKRIQELLTERDSVAVVEAAPGESYEKPSRSMDEVSSDLEEARKDYRMLDVEMARLNLNSYLEWDNQKYCITEAIELSKQVRGEAQKLKYFGGRKKQERETNWRNDSTVIAHAQYNPEEYRKKGLKLERQVNRLSTKIEAANHTVEFEFEPASRYLEG